MSVAFYLCMLAKCVLWIAMISFSISLFETRWPKNRIRIIGVLLFYIVSYSSRTVFPLDLEMLLYLNAPPTTVVT